MIDHTTLYVEVFIVAYIAVVGLLIVLKEMQYMGMSNLKILWMRKARYAVETMLDSTYAAHYL